ncbi:MAG: galactokinase [Bowdeniella nasicola]|nr:galactokinase [Bowdeniella nasicola]
MSAPHTWQTAPAWDLAEGTARVRALATRTYGQQVGDDDSAVLASAPGRVNIIGEHTDYNGGLALPIALPHRTYAWLRPRPDRTVRLVSAQAEEPSEVNLDEVGPADGANAVAGWAAYVVGVPWAGEQDGVFERCPGFDLAIDSCVPFGAGLSSSAALECVAAVALSAVSATPDDDLATLDDAARARLAEVCVRAENEIAGAPTGGMDQAASLRASAGHALALDCRTGEIERVPFDLAAAGLTLIVVDTRAPHALVDGQYAARRADCERAADLLGVDLLADVRDLSSAENALQGATASEDTERLLARMRHVVTEIERTRKFIDTLRQGGLTDAEGRETLGQLMYASHASLRDDYEVTCPELDAVVDVAHAMGALGARMTGGGFGGSAIALVERSQAEGFARSVREAFAARGFAAPHLYGVTPDDPALVHP